MAKQSFDRHLHLTDAHRTTGRYQGFDDGPLDDPVAEPLRPAQRADRLAPPRSRLVRNPSQHRLQEFRGV
jgi:hypothetical protein